jgi:hypothetical protein
MTDQRERGPKPKSSRSDRAPLLDVRAALIFLVALLRGVAGGVLSTWSGQSLPASVLVGGGAAGAALKLFSTIIR